MILSDLMGDIEKSIEQSNIFAKETIKIKNILDLITDDKINKNDFDKYCVSIEAIIFESYKNNSNDIEDLSDLIMLFDIKIEELFTSKENVDKFFNLVILRKKTKKLANKKFREGYDWIYKDQIQQNIIKSKIKYSDEQPRDYLMVENCEFQYSELVNHIWKNGLEKHKIILEKLNFFD